MIANGKHLLSIEEIAIIIILTVFPQMIDLFMSKVNALSMSGLHDFDGPFARYSDAIDIR